MVESQRYTDISAEALEVVHQQWVATLDAIRDSVFVVDSHHKLTRVNLSFAKLAERGYPELINTSIFAIFPWLEDEGGKIVCGQVVAPDGRIFRVREFLSEGRQCNRVHILEDVSELAALRLAEEKYREGTVKAQIECIEALARALETRDPYTSQHSINVAFLSRNIAVGIGLNEVQAQGIYYGAKVHDIGKLSVPSGILSRPGKLAEAEKNLIRMHCNAGYAVVKDLDFSWPVHDIVLQHHERLDGSGYPEGMQGEEISLAARIVAVADVVEAMSAHRPYRAALGFEAALSEVQAGAGIKYDARVVEACQEIAVNPEALFNAG